MAYSCPDLSIVKETLLNCSDCISKRTHAAFFLRTFYKEAAVDIISQALIVKTDSSLLRHELAYVLGQIGDSKACPLLEAILQDESDDILVRHESAEALGAIGEQSSVPVLERFINDKSVEISETCQISIDLIKWRHLGENKPTSGYLSVDPAPALPRNKYSIDQLKDILMDRSKSLFDRYRAMFTLRDMNNDESSLALLVGFSDESSLFRHEVAYVLGQMQRNVTISGLSEVLKNTNEHKMVRHEAAEALGAIGGSVVEELLSVYRDDVEDVVKESCVVALDTIEYWA